MQSRYIGRSNSTVAREKRGLDCSSRVLEGQSDWKRQRPALASVIYEAVKVDSVQRLCSSLEPIIRNVVGEELERALSKLAPAKLNGSVSLKRIEAFDGRNLQLHFCSRPLLSLFTGGKIEGEDGAPIHVVLLDASTGQIVASGPESSAKLDVVVLKGDFNKDDDDDWSQDDFASHLPKEREGKRPLLTGDLQVVLKGGVGTLGELTITDNSSWMRSRKFRLGLKLASGSCEGIRIREARTDAFTVKDNRGELYKKHHPPAPDDEVWRLEKIGKDGCFHKRLSNARILKVENFLLLAMRDPQKLRNILGSGMSNKMWDALLEHSKTCVVSGKLNVYYQDESKNVGIVFKNIHELCGMIYGGQYHSVDSLMEYQKVLVDDLLKKAYDNLMQVVEYDGKSLLDFNQNKRSDASQNNLRIYSEDQLNTFEQLSLPSHPASVPSQHLSVNQDFTLGGYSNNIHGQYPTQQLSILFSEHSQLINSTQQAHHSGNGNIPTLGPPHATMPSFHTGGTSNFTSFNEFEEHFVGDICIGSNEMPGSEEMQMQHMLPMFSMGGHSNDHFNANESIFAYSASTSNNPTSFSFDAYHTHSSGKAIVGWLKLKAALRWGIFIRKKAAERRAQIEELDDVYTYLCFHS